MIAEVWQDEKTDPRKYAMMSADIFKEETLMAEIYHGSQEIVKFPEIRKARYTKDFSWGFYCTRSYDQAKRWALRRQETGYVNVYTYVPDETLNIRRFETMSDEWLDFIAFCRAGNVHEYDIVEGPMADDQVWNYVNDYLQGEITREMFWERARFKHPTHQISFHTLRALNCLTYSGSEEENE